jgi:hypothetical protein
VAALKTSTAVLGRKPLAKKARLPATAAAGSRGEDSLAVDQWPVSAL